MKIEIYGEGDKEIIDRIKEFAKRLDIKADKIYLCFAENQEDVRKYYEKFSKFEELGELDEGEKEVYEKISSIPIAGGFLPKDRRKPNVPPVILMIREIADEDTLLDEVAHLKEEESGWRELNVNSLKEAISFSSWKPYELFFLHRVSSYISNFFADEIKCKYGYSDLVYREKRHELENIRKGNIPSKEEIKSKIKNGKLDLKPVEVGLSVSFGTSLPPSFSGDKDQFENELEKLISPLIEKISQSVSYKELKSTVKYIRFPPTKSNLDLAYAKFYNIFDEFLYEVID